MSTYKNQIVTRTAPLTPCQCAVLAVLNGKFSSPHEIRKRAPRYCRTHRRDSAKDVAYGTICAVLPSLVQQGFAEESSESLFGRGRAYRRK